MDPIVFYKCLADETRLRSLLLIQQETELCVCELIAALGQSQPKISRHLAQLRKYDLVVDRRQGTWVFYRINPALPTWAKDVLTSTTEQNRAFLQTNLHNLNSMGDRPTRLGQCC